MAVRISDALKAKLTPARANLLATRFGDWKSSCPAGEYDSRYFGKDSAYTTPKVGGQPYKLRHVHLPPVLDAQQLTRWTKALEFRSRKTSDHVLVYAENGAGDYLLIGVLDEPHAHLIARMETQENRELMESFAAIAEAFMHGEQRGWSA